MFYTFNIITFVGIVHVELKYKLLLCGSLFYYALLGSAWVLVRSPRALDGRAALKQKDVCGKSVFAFRFLDQPVPCHVTVFVPNKTRFAECVTYAKNLTTDQIEYLDKSFDV